MDQKTTFWMAENQHVQVAKKRHLAMSVDNLRNKEIEKGRVYLSKVIGFQGIRNIRVHTNLNNVVICEDIQTSMNVIAQICEIESEITEEDNISPSKSSVLCRVEKSKSDY